MGLNLVRLSKNVQWCTMPFISRPVLLTYGMHSPGMMSPLQLMAMQQMMMAASFGAPNMNPQEQRRKAGQQPHATQPLIPAMYGMPMAGTFLAPLI